MNIGCVVYEKDFSTGELTATWSFDDGTDIPLDWGDYNEGHEYSCYYTPSTSSLGMRIWDSAYGDNVGILTVDIYEWA